MAHLESVGLNKGTFPSAGKRSGFIIQGGNLAFSRKGNILL